MRCIMNAEAYLKKSTGPERRLELCGHLSLPKSPLFDPLIHCLTSMPIRVSTTTQLRKEHAHCIFNRVK